MNRSLLFHWFFSRNHFAKALACCNSPNDVRSSKVLYACYRLGMYKTVTSSSPGDGHSRGSFARAISLAACGREVEAAAITRKLSAESNNAQLSSGLAIALAPFAPELALELLEGFNAPADLRAALLLRVGRNEQATAVLHQATQVSRAGQFSELSLLLSNATPAPPVSQLKQMNTFLTAHTLTPLTLLDEANAPGPMNLTSAVEHTPVRGPLVTILMTAFNAAQRIVPAISSLMAQSYRDIEIIVIDDASTDDTGKVVQALAVADSRIVYIRLPRNVGTFVAKSVGLRHARGEFVMCHDSDDWSHPLRIERQVRPLITKREVVFTTSNWVRMQDDGIYYARPVNPLMRFNPASPMFRKVLVQERAGGWDPVRTGADSEFAARLMLVFGQRASHRVAQPLAFGAHRPGSLMTAVDTGYSTSGMSPTRLDYWESWNHHHIAELRAGRLPYVSPNLLEKRRFAAPPEIIVPCEDIEVCLG